MCGIAGYIGKMDIELTNINTTLSLMKNRGPDNQSHKQVSTLDSNNLNVIFLHSRLSIIDLSDRSNQPFTINESTIIFNGEIYNYLEIRKKLESMGAIFHTDSDTEVLLQSYRYLGDSFLENLEGMWSFAIWDQSKKTLLLSRDRFGEKPLYYTECDNGFYFASEVKMLKSLRGRTFDINENHLLRYIALGYKSLYKTTDTYFKTIKELKPSNCAKIREDLSIATYSYWQPNINIGNMSMEDAIEGSRHYLKESLKIRLRSDVPLAFCLSGGIDSAALVSLAVKEFNCNTTSFSIIESDERYNEYDNIIATVNDTGCKHFCIELSHKNTLDQLAKLINYHDAPIATTTYYVHSLLSQAISREGYKVSFSGTAADELYSGYYDHFLLHLAEIHQEQDYQTYLSDWQLHIAKFIRNPILQDSDLYLNNPNFRDHIFDNSKEFLSWINQDLKNKYCLDYTEKHYTKSLLRNRMLNEIFEEATAVILHEDDLNSMYYSIENRSPYLDRNLFEFMYSVPSKHLIKNGYGKYILRESLKGILNDKVRLDRQKKRFNASINSLIDLKDKETRELIFDKNNKIFNYVARDKVMPLLEQDNLPNHYSKFIFNLINAHFFLEAA